MKYSGLWSLILHVEIQLYCSSLGFPALICKKKKKEIDEKHFKRCGSPSLAHFDWLRNRL